MNNLKPKINQDMPMNSYKKIYNGPVKNPQSNRSIKDFCLKISHICLMLDGVVSVDINVRHSSNISKNQEEFCEFRICSDLFSLSRNHMEKNEFDEKLSINLKKTNQLAVKLDFDPGLIIWVLMKLHLKGEEIENTINKIKKKSSDLIDTHWEINAMNVKISTEVELVEPFMPSTIGPSNVGTFQNSSIHSLKLVGTGMFSMIDLTNEHPALAKSLIYIGENYKKNFTMRELADASYISPSHLSGLLKQRFGLSFKKILTHMRIEQAKYIFSVLPSRQITQVCIDVGFSDLSHFEKTFKKIEGATPSQFRKTYRTELPPLSIHR